MSNDKAPGLSCFELEIRNEIYQFVFANLEAMTSANLTILRTCRQTYHEAVDMAWSDASFKITHDNISRLRIGLESIGKIKASKIKTVELPPSLLWNETMFTLGLLMLNGNLLPRSITVQLLANATDRSQPSNTDTITRVFKFAAKIDSILVVHLRMLESPSQVMRMMMKSLASSDPWFDKRCFGEVLDDSMLVEFKSDGFELKKGRVFKWRLDGEPRWSRESLEEVSTEYGFTKGPL
jgi:hypothetical protein